MRMHFTQCKECRVRYPNGSSCQYWFFHYVGVLFVGKLLNLNYLIRLYVHELLRSPIFCEFVP